MRYRTFLYAIFLVIFVLGVSFIIKSANPVAADSNGNVSGFAWSSNIGWISFNGPTYSVKMNVGTDNIGIFSNDSYAWGSNIGWIKFDSSLIGPSSPTDGVRVETDGRVTGWARACTVFVSGCSGSLKGLSYLGGWDGWIKMDPTGNVANDVHLVANEFQGYAWGSDIVGWINFCQTPGTNACVTLDSIDVSCSASPNPAVTPPDVDVTWTASPSDNTTYKYDWTSWSDGTSDQNDAGPSVIKTYSASQSGQTVTGTLTVTNRTDSTKKGSADCSVPVTNPNQKTLNVYLTGDGTSFGAEVIDDSNLLTGCTGGGTFCTHDYTVVGGVGPSVILTRSPDPIPNADIAFFSWATTPPGLCLGNGLTCSLTMDQNVDVYASFTVGGAPLDASLTVDTSFIKINFQNAGVPSDSTVANINVANNSDVNIRVCLKSVKSKINSQTLDDVINTISSSNEKPKCHLGETGDTQCNSGQNCVVVNSLESTSIPFFITIADKFYDILKYSPYKIEIEAKNGNEVIGTLTSPLEFRYQVPDLHPR